MDETPCICMQAVSSLSRVNRYPRSERCIDNKRSNACAIKAGKHAELACAAAMMTEQPLNVTQPSLTCRG